MSNTCFFAQLRGAMACKDNKQIPFVDYRAATDNREDYFHMPGMRRKELIFSRIFALPFIECRENFHLKFRQVFTQKGILPEEKLSICNFVSSAMATFVGSGLFCSLATFVISGLFCGSASLARISCEKCAALFFSVIAD